MDTEIVRNAVLEVLKEMKINSTTKNLTEKTIVHEDYGYIDDITAKNLKDIVSIENNENKDFLIQAKQNTSARLGMGRCGFRAKTSTNLRFLADHASSIDSVFSQVSRGFLTENNLQVIKTKCKDKDEHITRPDLGREFQEDEIHKIKQLNSHKPDVVIYISDGLSSKAVEENAMDCYMILKQGLLSKGITVGEPFFVEYGRVQAMDVISETIGCKVLCVLIGERPGLVTAESMSAYIGYKTFVDIPEAKRSVISNIHKGGTSAVEAGAFMVDLIEKMLIQKASGLDLKD